MKNEEQVQSVKRVSLLRKKYLVKLRAQVIELLFRVTEETLKKRKFSNWHYKRHDRHDRFTGRLGSSDREED